MADSILENVPIFFISDLIEMVRVAVFQRVSVWLFLLHFSSRFQPS